jgi:transposase
VSLLLELNIRISNRKGGIISAIDGVLEDATNDLSAECRKVIYTTKVHLKGLIEAVDQYDDCLEKSANLWCYGSGDSSKYSSSQNEKKCLAKRFS